MILDLAMATWDDSTQEREDGKAKLNNLAETFNFQPWEDGAKVLWWGWDETYS